MERVSENAVMLTQEEIASIAEFIHSALDSQWDRYTDNYISSTPWMEGMRQMNPEMYDLMEKINSL